MGFFKKTFSKNVTRDNEFLKNYATKCNALLMYVENNEILTKELCKLRDDLQYTVATDDSAAKKYEKKIKHCFETLTGLVSQPNPDEEQVLFTIKDVRRYIVEISSMR